ncbi:hypothetical protein H0H92_015819, partial [Tricholoma furcatifolium]
MQPPNRPSNTPPPNSQPLRDPTPLTPQMQPPNRSSITPPPSTQPRRPPTPMSSPTQHPDRQSLTLPPNGQPRRDNFSPPSGSDYEEDARAVEVRRSQIHPKWRKPTIEEQDALDEEEFEQE